MGKIADFGQRRDSGGRGSSITQGITNNRLWAGSMPCQSFVLPHEENDGEDGSWRRRIAAPDDDTDEFVEG